MLVSSLRDNALKNLALVIDGMQEVVTLSFDLHEHPVGRPLACQKHAQLLHPFLTDLGRKQRAKSVLPELYGFVSDVNPEFTGRVVDIAKRQSKPGIEHDRQADGLGAGSEVAKRAAFDHCRALLTGPRTPQAQSF